MLSSGGTKCSLKMEVSCSTTGLVGLGVSGPSLEALRGDDDSSLKRLGFLSNSSLAAETTTHMLYLLDILDLPFFKVVRKTDIILRIILRRTRAAVCVDCCSSPAVIRLIQPITIFNRSLSQG